MDHERGDRCLHVHGHAPHDGRRRAGRGTTPPAAVSQFCDDGIRDPVTEECDLGKGSEFPPPARDVCSAACTVNDLIGVADNGQPPPGEDAAALNQLTRRDLDVGRHPVAGGANGDFAWVFVEPDSMPVRVGLSTVGANGAPLDKVVTVNAASTAVATSNPVVAGVPGGPYAVAYTDYGGDGDELGVALLLVDPSSPPTAAPGHANTTTQFSQYDPDLIATSTGLVAAWVDDSDPATAPDLKVRTFGFDLTATSGEQDLAHTASSEANVALASFAGGWAAAWRAANNGTETLHVKTFGAVRPDVEWTIGPYAPGAADDRPALAEIDPTHMLVAFSQGTDPQSTGVANGSKVSVALLDTGFPGAAMAVDLPGGASNWMGTAPLGQSQPTAVRAGSTVYLGWRTDAVVGDSLGYGEDLWLQRIPTALTSSSLDFSSLVRPLPRLVGHRAGDQRRPAFGAGHDTAGGEVVVAYEDWGQNYGPGPEVVAIEDIPSPVVRPCTDANDCQGTGGTCESPGDCQNAVCTAGVCAAASCSDNATNGSETDWNCGGGICPPCKTGLHCKFPTDCRSQICTGNVCQRSCVDGDQNGDETYIDCGGSCPGCPVGDPCRQGADCLSGSCINLVCASPTCHDNTKNGGETGVDCGGTTTCARCPPGQGCMAPSDCTSSVCTGGICQAPTCMDNTKNGSETDTDCGGSCSNKCAVGQTCSAPSDCLSGNCQGNVCAPPCGTCSSLGACGSVVDGCGNTLNCGSCTGAQTCGGYGANTCGLVLDDFSGGNVSLNLLGGNVNSDHLTKSISNGELQFTWNGSSSYDDYLSYFRRDSCEYDLSAYTAMRFQFQASAPGEAVDVVLAMGDGSCPLGAPSSTKTWTFYPTTTLDWHPFDISTVAGRNKAMWVEFDPHTTDNTTYHVDNIEFRPAMGGGGACATCASLGYNCGTASDGCGHTLNCGSCTGAETCGSYGPNVCGLLMDDFSGSVSTNLLHGDVISDHLTKSLYNGELKFTWSRSSNYDDYLSYFRQDSCESNLSAYTTMRFQLQATAAGKAIKVVLAMGDGSCPLGAPSSTKTWTIMSTTSLDWYPFDISLVSGRSKALWIELDPQVLDGTTYNVDNIEFK